MLKLSSVGPHALERVLEKAGERRQWRTRTRLYI